MECFFIEGHQKLRRGGVGDDERSGKLILRDQLVKWKVGNSEYYLMEAYIDYIE